MSKKSFGLIPVLVLIKKIKGLAKNYCGLIIIDEKVIFHFNALTLKDVADFSVKLRNKANIDERLLHLSIVIKNSSGKKIVLNQTGYDFFYNILVNHIGKLEYDIISGALKKRKSLINLTTSGWFGIPPCEDTDCYCLSISSRLIPQDIKECETLLLT